MSELKLKSYLVRINQTLSGLSREIGQTRQNVWNWVKDGATVELTDIGIRIRLKSGRIVYETQVAK